MNSRNGMGGREGDFALAEGVGPASPTGPVHAGGGMGSVHGDRPGSAHAVVDVGLLSPVTVGSPAAAATGDVAFLQAMLDAEGALARALACVGVIPEGAAAAITRVAADSAGFDAASIALRARSGGNPVLPLVADLTARVAESSPGSAQFVHAGATSQDIVDTAMMLVAWRTRVRILGDLDDVVDRLAELADRHRHTVMAARTLTQHAVPTTFGLKATGWLSLVADARHRVAGVRLPAQLGGAAGTLAAFPGATPETGIAAVSTFARELGLDEPLLPWHVLRTPTADLAAALATTSGALGKIAEDVLTLSRTEIAELAEGDGGKSSAMPHKSNPVRATLIAATARQVPALAQVLFAAMPAADERPAGAWHAEWSPLRDSLRLVGGAAATAADLVRGLRVDPARMRTNLDLTGGAILSERLTTLAAPHIGRATARRAVERALTRSAETGLPLPDAIAEDPQLGSTLGERTDHLNTDATSPESEATPDAHADVPPVANADTTSGTDADLSTDVYAIADGDPDATVDAPADALTDVDPNVDQSASAAAPALADAAPHTRADMDAHADPDPEPDASLDAHSYAAADAAPAADAVPDVDVDVDADPGADGSPAGSDRAARLVPLLAPEHHTGAAAALVERALRAHRRAAVVRKDDFRMTAPIPHHRVDGDTGLPPLVLGPSLGTTTSIWGQQVPVLTGDFQVIRWDLPGHGPGVGAGNEPRRDGEPCADNAPAADGALTVADLGSRVLALADSLGIDRFAYAGISLGGAVGAWLAAHHPSRISALALICSSAHFGPPEPWHERAALVRADNSTDQVADTAASRWFTPAFATTEAAQALVAGLRNVAPDGYAAGCDALAAYDLRADLHRITAPTLVLAGRDDPATPPTHARELADGITDATLVELPHAAHLANIEQPDQVSALLTAHLRAATTANHTTPDYTVAGTRADAANGAHIRAGAGAAAGTDALRRSRGTAVRRAVLGDAHVDRAVARTTEFTAPFQDFITRYAWGEIWTRPGLDRRSRSCVTLTALVAGGHHDELAMHVRAALTNGLSTDEIREVLLQTAVYCGVPAANAAFAVADRILAELGATTEAAELPSQDAAAGAVRDSAHGVVRDATHDSDAVRQADLDAVPGVVQDAASDPVRHAARDTTAESTDHARQEGRTP